MDFGAEAIRAKIVDHYRHAGVDEYRANESYYHDDAILEFPQGGERVRTKASITALRNAYPAQVRVIPRRIIGEGNLWVHEGTITYDGVPSFTFSIIEFRDGKVARETIYVNDGWDPPEWRAQWVEPMKGTDLCT